MEGKHVHWKRPAVDTIFKYEQTTPALPQNEQSKPAEKVEAHVHWKEPVESVHEYDKILPPSLCVGWKDPVVQGRYLYPEVRTVPGPSPDLSETTAAKGTLAPSFSDCLRSTGGPWARYDTGTPSFRKFGG